MALAWVSAQSTRLEIPVIPIPGTKRVHWVEQNVAELDSIGDFVVGARY